MELIQALKSKTVWFGILQAIGASALAVFAGGITKESVVLFATGAITIVLRGLTSQPLSEK